MALCPNCRQPLPDPPESFCPSCGAALGAAARPLPPQGAGGSIPWEERERRGFVGAFFETTKEVLTAPGSFFRRMPVAGGIPGPLLYGTLAGYVGLVAGAVYSMVIQTLFAGSLAGLGGQGDGNPLAGVLGGGVVSLIVQVVCGRCRSSSACSWSRPSITCC